VNGLLSAAELAEYLGVAVNTVYVRAASGELPCYRIGAVVRFDLAEVLASVRANPLLAQAGVPVIPGQLDVWDAQGVPDPNEEKA
jgi:excisionase family DNA binding protein